MGKGIKSFELSVIIINYNSLNYSKLLVSSLLKFILNVNYEIIIIDNNSNDDISSLELFNSKITTYKLKQNIGFGAANNFGASKSNGEYLFFLNSDTELLDFNFNMFLNYLKANSRIGIIAPQILNYDYSLQYNSRLSPNFFSILLFSFGLNHIINLRKLYDYKMELYDHKSILNPDWVSGAGFVISSKLFEIVNGFNVQYFFYYEDVDICRKVRELGLQIICYNRFKIKHYGGGSSVNLQAYTEFFHVKSRFIYFKLNSSYLNYVLIKILTFINLLFRSLYYFMILKFNYSYIYIKILFKLIFPSLFKNYTIA